MPRAGKDSLQVAGPRRSFVRAIGDIAQRQAAVVQVDPSLAERWR